MKKLKFLLTTLLIGVLLFALTACGGAEGALSGFVAACKKGEFEKAATYVVGDFDWEDTREDTDDSIYKYILQKTVGSFEYKVKESSMNSDETACTIEISYSCHSSVTVWTTYGLQVALGAEQSKATVDEILKMDKTERDMTVNLKKNDEGKWLLSLESAAALIGAIYA